MGAINFTKGDYGTTIIMDSYTHPDLYEFDEIDEDIVYEYINDVYSDFYEEIQNINSEISQNLSKYEDFLDVDNPAYIVTQYGYYEGYEAYIDSDTNMKRYDYKTDEEYKQAIIDEYVKDADKYCREKYVDDKFTNQDFDKLLDEYRQDLNTAFNEIDYELVKLGKDYGMATLDQNGWVSKTHQITDKDVQITKNKLDNQKTKEKVKTFEDFER